MTLVAKLAHELALVWWSQSSKSRFYCPKERAGLWLRVGMCNLDDNVQLRCVAKVCS